MKAFKIILIVIFLLLLFLAGSFQYEVESWRIKQNKKYGIVEGKQRISYMPAFWFYLFCRTEETRRSCYMPYINKKLHEFCAMCLYDQYIVKCYFTKEEINLYLNTKENR